LRLVEREIQDLGDRLSRELAAIETGYRPEDDELQETRHRPKKSDIAVEAVELVWVGDYVELP
jgi:hypothetical protein